MEHITYGNRKIKFNIKRGKRKKTVALQIQPNSTVVVLSPYFLDKDKIKEIVRKRARWIIQKQEKIKKLNAEMPKKEFVSGESFPYLGREYRLKVIKSEDEKCGHCKLMSGRFYVEINNKFSGRVASKIVKENLLEWYIERAKEKINERVQRYSKLIGIIPQKIIIRNQEKRWGSCSHSGVLRFNWKAIMAPLSVLDYVIVHELCHLIHQNHSPDFWGKVESIISSYKDKRSWLKENSFLLAELLN
ncbi:MAG: M48 family peptidase [Thermodesulfovibrio sp.]|nr:M48 family peptidase [Thermodesulfovibrio sp.]